MNYGSDCCDVHTIAWGKLFEVHTSSLLSFLTNLKEFSCRKSSVVNLALKQIGHCSWQFCDADRSTRAAICIFDLLGQPVGFQNLGTADMPRGHHVAWLQRLLNTACPEVWRISYQTTFLFATFFFMSCKIGPRATGLPS